MFHLGHVVNLYLSLISQTINKTTLCVMLSLGLALSPQQNNLLHRFQNWVLYSHFQNILAQYSFSSIMYFEEKTTKNC
jgi:uncharacterized membrane protein YhfC